MEVVDASLRGGRRSAAMLAAASVNFADPVLPASCHGLCQDVMSRCPSVGVRAGSCVHVVDSRVLAECRGRVFDRLRARWRCRITVC